MLRIALTPGDPAGIGLDLAIQIAYLAFPAEIVAICDKTLLRERAKTLDLALELEDFNPTQAPQQHRRGKLIVSHIPCINPVVCGKPDPKNAAYIINTLTAATHGCMQSQFAAIVTGPVSKALIMQAGIPFTGHTEFFAEITNSTKAVMLFVSNQHKVALVTTHLPLNQVAASITPTHLETTILTLHQGLKDLFGYEKPRISICGLNPHAGEKGYLGTEEQTVIKPVIQKLKQKGLHLSGPFAADTLFTKPHLQQADAILAMYHDQGLPVVKYASFGQSVNVTLGLPIIRTSVDHGTAFQLAGSGKADADSLFHAIRLAIELALGPGKGPFAD